MAGWKREIESDRRGESWQITYCSMIIILVAIFLMVLSYSRIEGKKMNGFLSRIEGKRLPGNAAIRGGGRNDAEAQIGSAMDAMRKIIATRVGDDQASIIRIRKGFKVTFADKVFFSSGSMKIRDEAVPLLDDLASAVRETPFVVGIAGHGDTDAAAETASRSSWEVTAARAGLMMRYLSEKGGIPLKRLAAAGFGHYRPAASGDGPESRDRNRRVELYVELP